MAQPLSYQAFLWLFLCLFLWGGRSLGVTRHSYGYSYGMAPASELLGIPVAFLCGCPSLRVTSYYYPYSYRVAQASGLPAIPMAIPMGWPQALSYQVFLWLFLWGGPSL